MIERDGAFVHESACIDEQVTLGAGTYVWHFVHVMRGARIGARCVLGQGVHVASRVTLGDGVRVQNQVSIYDGVEIEDDVFLGPSCVLTNVKNPRAGVVGERLVTRIRRGATIGANATIVCGVTVGRYAFVGAGAVVTHDVPDHALVVGTPARVDGYVGRNGQRLRFEDGLARDGETQYSLREGRCEELA